MWRVWVCHIHSDGIANHKSMGKAQRHRHTSKHDHRHQERDTVTTPPPRTHTTHHKPRHKQGTTNEPIMGEREAMTLFCWRWRFWLCRPDKYQICQKGVKNFEFAIFPIGGSHEGIKRAWNLAAELFLTVFESGYYLIGVLIGQSSPLLELLSVGHWTYPN